MSSMNWVKVSGDGFKLSDVLECDELKIRKFSCVGLTRLVVPLEQTKCKM